MLLKKKENYDFLTKNSNSKNNDPHIIYNTNIIPEEKDINSFKEKLLNIEEDFEIKKKIQKKKNFIYFINKIRGLEPRTDFENILFIFLGNLTFSLSHLMIKIMTKFYPNTNGLNINIYRYFFTTILSYYFIWLLDIKIINYKKIERLFLFISRIFSNFFLMICSANSIYYLRFGTSIALFRLAPFFTSILSVIFLGEKCLLRYLIGFIIGFIAIILFSLGDLKSDINDFQQKEEKKEDILIGLFWSISAIFFNCYGITATKILVSNMDQLLLILPMGVGGFLLSVIFSIFTLQEFIFDLFFIFLSGLSGIFMFMTLFLMISNFKNNNLILVNTFSYFSVFLAFFYGITFFAEDIVTNDTIAFLLLFSFSMFNIKYPPKRD